MILAQKSSSTRKRAVFQMQANPYVTSHAAGAPQEYFLALPQRLPLRRELANPQDLTEGEI